MEGESSTISSKEFEGEILDILLNVNDRCVHTNPILYDKHIQDRAAKRARIEPSCNATANTPFDAKVKDRRQVAEATWLPKLGLVELIKMRGNFWKVMGFSQNRKNYLQPEEALLLIEKAQLCVTNEELNHIPSSLFYDEVLYYIPQPCYLTYVKLKSLEYVTFRHKQTPRAFTGDEDIYQHMAANPKAGLLESLIAFDVYAHTANWSKKQMSDKLPTSYVLVMTGDWTLSGRLKLRLLEDARGVPVIFAAVLPSGNLILEEFTDARYSLDWKNEYRCPIDMNVDLTTLPTPIDVPSFSFSKDEEEYTNAEDDSGDEDED